MHPGQLADLVQQHHADLHRDAAASRLAATRVDAADPDGVLVTRPRRPLAGRSRRRLGLILVAWGSRLAPVPNEPC